MSLGRFLDIDSVINASTPSAVSWESLRESD